MASGWDVINMMKTFTYIILLASFVISCSTTESVTESDEPVPYIDVSDEVVDEFVMENLDDFERTLLATRNQLSDQFEHLEHDMPEVFLREVVQEEEEVDEYAGFRVQIASTRDVVHADSTKDNFVAWADSVITGYQADAYIFFRPPYYRVHAGDFHDRDTAIEFSRLLKQRYPDAWVVHDRIEPEKVPADTIKIQFKIPEVIEELE
ncbi:MAG: SPOR domain-containing protein [Balneolaceae bacterium]